MKTDRTLALLALLPLLALAACSDHAANPAAPAGDAAKAADQRNDGNQRGGLDQAFLASLQQAFDNTTWERVRFSEQTRDGAQIAYPKSFDEGDFLQMTVNPGKHSRGDLPEVEVYVSATLESTPGRCVLFKFVGMVEGAEYVIETFLPAWYDDLDLGERHHTYELALGADGQTYEARWVTEFLTPPTPWELPPVEFTVLGADPSGADPSKWVLDPNGGGND